METLLGGKKGESLFGMGFWGKIGKKEGVGALKEIYSPKGIWQKERVLGRKELIWERKGTNLRKLFGGQKGSRKGGWSGNGRRCKKSPLGIKFHWGDGGIISPQSRLLTKGFFKNPFRRP